jgi:acyl-CoA thioester hydrolase
VDGFPFVHREAVRWRDLDVLGHVNNAVFLSYIEQARISFFASLGLVDDSRDPKVILARVAIDFRSPAEHGEVIDVGVRPSHLGTKSFELEHELRAGGRLVAEAQTVLVAYDYARDESVVLPDEWRKRMAA